MLTMYTDAAHLRGALQAGARGYLVKDAEPDAIVRAIERRARRPGDLQSRTSVVR